MADEIYRMEDLYAEDIVDNIDEVREARGTYDTLGDRLDALTAWTKSENKLADTTSISSRFDVENSSLYVYHNAALKRIVISVTLKTTTALTAPVNAFNLGTTGLADKYPLGAVQCLYMSKTDSNNYTWKLAKNNSTQAVTFSLQEGEIPSGTTITGQLEYTYFDQEGGT